MRSSFLFNLIFIRNSLYFLFSLFLTVRNIVALLAGSLRSSPCFFLSPPRFICHRQRFDGSTPYLDTVFSRKNAVFARLFSSLSATEKATSEINGELKIDCHPERAERVEGSVLRFLDRLGMTECCFFALDIIRPPHRICVSIIISEQRSPSIVNYQLSIKYLRRPSILHSAFYLLPLIAHCAF